MAHSQPMRIFNFGQPSAFAWAIIGRTDWQRQFIYQAAAAFTHALILSTQKERPCRATIDLGGSCILTLPSVSEKPSNSSGVTFSP